MYELGLSLPSLSFNMQEQVSFASLLTSTLAIGLTKISVLLLYRRIFQGTATTRWFSIATWLLLGIAILWTISFFFSNLFECKNPAYNWFEYGAQDGYCISDENTMYLAQAWIDAFTDRESFEFSCCHLTNEYSHHPADSDTLCVGSSYAVEAEARRHRDVPARCNVS